MIDWWTEDMFALTHESDLSSNVRSLVKHLGSTDAYAALSLASPGAEL